MVGPLGGDARRGVEGQVVCGGMGGGEARGGIGGDK